jgi:uncharacterized protein
MPMKRIAKHALAAVILLLCVAAPVAAQQGLRSSPAISVEILTALNAFDRGDYAFALRIIRPLADQGIAGAQQALGAMYLEGFDGSPDAAAAVSWFRKAADQGHALAQYGLGAVYYDGRGAPQDYVLAHMWFNLAAATGMVDSAAGDRDMVAAKMTPAQIAEAQKLAREWKPK